MVQVLNKHVVDALGQPDVRAKLGDLGAVIVASSPSDFQQYIASETAKWFLVAKSNKIVAD